MKTQEFLNLLKDNSQKEVVFEYEDGAYVAKNYHITEIKNVTIDSVDCGKNVHYEEQTVVQLKNGNALEVKSRFMSAEKAMKIFTLVDSVKPLRQKAEIFFEYGNKTIKTSIHKVVAIDNEADRLTVKLFVPPTVCKPQEAAFKALNLAPCCAPSSSGRC